MNRVVITVLGSILILLGALSLILGVLGLSLTPLLFLDRLENPLLTFLLKLGLLIIGFVMFYMGRITPEEPDE